jgi:ATPase subunit of ABC transporter with duplicated ATPase domains
MQTFVFRSEVDGTTREFFVFGPCCFSKIQDGQAVLFLSNSFDPQSAGRTKLVYCLSIRQNSVVVVVHCAKLTMASEQDSEVVDLTEAGDPAQPEQKRSKRITSFFSAYDPNNAEHVAAKDARERREAERALEQRKQSQAKKDASIIAEAAAKREREAERKRQARKSEKEREAEARARAEADQPVELDLPADAPEACAPDAPSSTVHTEAAEEARSAGGQQEQVDIGPRGTARSSTTGEGVQGALHTFASACTH